MADSETKEDRAIVDWDRARQETIDKLIVQRDELLAVLRKCCSDLEQCNVFADGRGGTQTFGYVEAQELLAAIADASK